VEGRRRAHIPERKNLRESVEKGERRREVR